VQVWYGTQWKNVEGGNTRSCVSYVKLFCLFIFSLEKCGRGKLEARVLRVPGIAVPFEITDQPGPLCIGLDSKGTELLANHLKSRGIADPSKDASKDRQRLPGNRSCHRQQAAGPCQVHRGRDIYRKKEGERRERERERARTRAHVLHIERKRERGERERRTKGGREERERRERARAHER
jgi:hypothetical protein